MSYDYEGLFSCICVLEITDRNSIQPEVDPYTAKWLNNIVKLLMRGERNLNYMSSVRILKAGVYLISSAIFPYIMAYD